MPKEPTNFYNELQKIATQGQPTAPTQVNVDAVIEEFSAEKLESVTKLANTMYPTDASSRFDLWKSKINTSALSPKTKESYWKTYETMHPEGKVGATRDFLNVTKRELEVVDGLVGKEFFLRERLSDTPKWARKELDPVLGELSATVANSNFSKSQQIYMQDLEARMGSFMTTAELDPDIPIDTHTADAARLEQLNLMSLGKVKSGRIGVYNEKGQFFPAFGIKDRSEIFKKDVGGAPGFDEQRLIRDLSPNIIRNAVAGNLAVRRNTIQSQERTGAVITNKYLKTGAFDMDKWDTAFAMLPDVPIFDKISMGLQGEIASRRVTSEKQLVQSIFQAMLKYKNLFKDTNDSTT